jgi:hypothetical protein
VFPVAAAVISTFSCVAAFFLWWRQPLLLAPSEIKIHLMPTFLVAAPRNFRTGFTVTISSKSCATWVTTPSLKTLYNPRIQMAQALHYFANAVDSIRINC